MQGPALDVAVLQVGGAGIGGAHQAEDPGAGTGRGLDQGLEGVAAEQRVDGEGVRPEAGHRAPRGRGLADERLAVGPRRARHVTALAVGDDEQPPLRAAAAVSASARQPGAPRRSKQASWGLTATQAGPAALDQLAAVGDDSIGGALRRARRSRRPSRPRAPSNVAGSGSRPRQT